MNSAPNPTLYWVLKNKDELIIKQFCQFLTEWSKIAITIFNGYFHQIQMVVKFLIVLNGKELIPIVRGDLIQEFGEAADVTSFVGLEVGGDEDNALVGQSVASFGIVPEADVETDAIFADRHIEANLVSLKCNVIHTDTVVLIEVHGNVEH